MRQGTGHGFETKHGCHRPRLHPRRFSWPAGQPRRFPRFFAVYAADGKFLQSRSIIIHLTERRKAEKAQRDAEEALRRSRDELSAANIVLEKAARLKDEFLANMSHELRTPLNAILALSESLLEQVRGPLNERQQAALRNIEASGRHLLTLINDILDLSKVEAGQLHVQIQSVPVTEVCQASLLFVKEVAGKKSLALALQPNDHMAMVQADPKRLKQRPFAFRA